MPRVDFYILPEQGDQHRFTCEISTKIRQQALQLYIHTSSREEACKLDELLWTFSDISFLPHCMIDADNAADNTITIGWEGKASESRQALINLSDSIPEFVTDYQRIVEIVPPDEPSKQRARERYKQYREAGFELHNNDLRNSNVSA